jgi:hypothetical protein
LPEGQEISEKEKGDNRQKNNAQEDAPADALVVGPGGMTKVSIHALHNRSAEWKSD